MSDDYATKRRFPRIPSENAVLVKKTGPEESEGFAKTQVVGGGGCMFLSDESIGVGSRVELLISVHGRVIRARARVVYEIPRDDGQREVGVEFTDIGADDRGVIEGLLSGESEAG